MAQNTTPEELAAYYRQLGAMGLETQQGGVEKQLAALGYTAAGKPARTPQWAAVPAEQQAAPPVPAGGEPRQQSDADRRKADAERRAAEQSAAASAEAAKGPQGGKAEPAKETAKAQPPAGRHTGGDRQQHTGKG